MVQVISTDNRSNGVSVCVPCYEMGSKGVNFLEDLLNSLQTQTCLNFEIIVSDQSRNNQIKEFIESYNSRVPVIYAKSSGRSASSNMNAALKLSNYQIIKPMFQDDRVHSDELIETIINSEFYWGAVGADHIDVFGQSVGRKMFPKWNSLIMLGRNTIGCPSVIFFQKKDGLQFNEDLINLMDCDFYQKLYMLYGYPDLIKRYLIDVRLWSGTVSAGVDRFINLRELRLIGFRQWSDYPVRFKANGMLPYFDLSDFSNVNITVDNVDPKKNCTNFYFQVEPACVNKGAYKIIDNQDKYCKIFAWDEKILSECKHSELFLYGTSWVANYCRELSPRSLGVTMMTSGKSMTSGHILRHEILRSLMATKFAFPLNIHVSPPYLIDKSSFLLRGKYSIVVENARENNWFTEKLLDCIMLGVVPIYWGCPNIGSFFDVNGIIQFETLEELVEILESIVSDWDYECRLKSLKENRYRAYGYCRYNKRMTAVIRAHLENV